MTKRITPTKKKSAPAPSRRFIDDTQPSVFTMDVPRPSSLVAPRDASARSLVDIDPRRLSELVLTLPLRCGANLVALAPGPTACSLVVKRGSVTLAAVDVPLEVAMAAAVRLACVADIDPLSLSDASQVDGVARRVKVAAGDDHGELLLSFSSAPDGIGVEARPLSVNGAAPEIRKRSQLKRCEICGTVQIPLGSICEVDGGPLVELIDNPEPGGLIGLYRLGKILGEGGMGFVIAGEHALLGKPVAIKLLHRTMDQDPLAGRRFLAEARAASWIRHPNIVDVIDYGLLGDGRPYIVMERLEGESLQERLDRTEVLEPTFALLLAREIALALGAAHEGGVVHLDLKPSNVFLLQGLDESAPRIKLIDFGVAERVGTTPSDDLTGTPAYMSPEHARGDPADGRSDLYALGIILYEMLTGTVPFAGDNIWAVLKAHMLDEPSVVWSPLRQLPEAVVNIVSRALRKNADERHQSAGEMTADVARGLASLRRKEWQRWLP